MANFITVITQSYLLIFAATPCRHPIFLLLPVSEALFLNKMFQWIFSANVLLPLIYSEVETVVSKVSTDQALQMKILS